jgi:protein phosphatase 1 regulatory subunit 7
LKKVEAIGGTWVETLHIETCSSIQDFAALAKCKSLRRLRYINCGVIGSLAPLRDFKALEEFRFVKTNVLDGDMTPLMSLKSIGFENKRHYSHTPEQIDAAIRGEAVFLRRSVTTH